MTVLELLTASMHRLGYLEATETPRAADLDAVKQAANDLIDAWRLDDLLCYRVQRHTLSLVASTPTYTIGPSGGSLTAALPIDLERAGLVLDPSATSPRETPMAVLSAQEWASIRAKSATSDYPDSVYLDRTVASGLATLYVFPVPSSSTPDLALYLRVALDELGENDVELELATGYRRALVTNIALEAASLLGVEPSAWLTAQAAEAKADVQRSNVRIEELQLGYDTPGMGRRTRYNINLG